MQAKSGHEVGPPNNFSDEPHVLIFPLPAQGHVNSMLKLAELLLLSGLHVSFLNSEHNHRLLLLHTDLLIRFSRYPKSRFETISDGLPADHSRSGIGLMDLVHSIPLNSAHLFRELLTRMRSSGGSEAAMIPPVSCLIVDGIFGFAIDAAKELGVFGIAFRTISPSCAWTYFCLPELIQSGEIPFTVDEMDEPVTSVPGMETFLRRRDLPSFCRVKDTSDKTLQLILTESRATTKADAHIFNTFEELEEPILTHFRSHCQNIYTIGPLHAHLKSKLQSQSSTPPSSNNSLFEVDRSCMSWLDSQQSKSVIYVSFGSITSLSRDQYFEIWHGLMNSGKNFLWVIRQDSIIGGVISDAGADDITTEFIEGSKERGCIVGWAPQEEVLDHEAIGGFWTHSGWNSTLESIVAGVPMICWPYFADQLVNSRFVSEVWKIGLDMKDVVCDRVIVERMVNDLMEVRREEFVKSSSLVAEMVKKCLSPGGSSYCCLDRLVKDIKLKSIRNILK